MYAQYFLSIKRNRKWVLMALKYITSDCLCHMSANGIRTHQGYTLNISSGISTEYISLFTYRPSKICVTNKSVVLLMHAVSP